MNLIVLNDGSTKYFRGRIYTSCLDITVCSSTISPDVLWMTDFDTMGSDHLPIFVSLPFARATRRKVRITNWRMFSASADGSVEGFAGHDQLNSVISNSITLATKVISGPSRLSVVDAEYERLRAIRRRTERRFRRTGNFLDFKEACKTRAVVRRHLQQLARHSWRSFCATLSPHTPATRILQVVKGIGSHVEQQYHFQGLALRLGIEESALAYDFCKLFSRPYFASLNDIHAASETTARQGIDMEANARDECMEIDFRARELEAAVRSCSRRSSPGPDGISYRAIAQLGPKAMDKLLSLLSTTWRDGKHLQPWKLSCIVPVLKHGKSQTALESFRPISLSSCVCKLAERIILRHLECHLESGQLLPQAMAEFRNPRCTMNSVLDLVTSIEEERASGRLTVAVFMDVKRAYDTVSHTHVLHA